MTPRTDLITFELTAEHVALLRRANVSWWGAEWGSPAIDCKRPFGNGDLYRDIHEVLDPAATWNSSYGLPEGLTAAEWDAKVERYKVLYPELKTALQVVLAAGSFEPGTYESNLYYDNWRQAE